MKQRRSRLALLGVMALALCVTLGLMAGAADAKKKGKKKGAKKVTVSKTTPTPIPGATADQGTVTEVPLTVGKKAKKKVVAPDSVAVTVKLSGPVPPPNDGNLGHLGLAVSAPNGRRVFFDYPDDHNASVIGPLTVSANSSADPCIPSLTPPPPPCFFASETVGPPYAGTIGDPALALFSGIGAKGTWTFRVFNGNQEAFSLDSVSLRIPLRTAPS